MKYRNGKKSSHKKFAVIKIIKKQSAKMLTLSFWRRIALAGFVVMAAVGSYVTLNSFSYTKSLVKIVEKPVVNTWQGFTGSEHITKSKVASKAKSKKYRKSSYKKKKSKVARKSKAKKKSRYSKNRRSKHKKSGKVISSSYKYVRR